jgi:hypothetical protein
LNKEICSIHKLLSICEFCIEHSREAITALSKKAAYKSDKGYYKVIKAPPEKAINIKPLLKSDKK